VESLSREAGVTAKEARGTGRDAEGPAISHEFRKLIDRWDSGLGSEPLGRLLQCNHYGAGVGKDDIWRERDQLRRVAANLVGIARGPANFEAQVAALGPAELLEPLQECRKASLPTWTIR